MLTIIGSQNSFHVKSERKRKERNSRNIRALATDDGLLVTGRCQGECMRRQMGETCRHSN